MVSALTYGIEAYMFLFCSTLESRGVSRPSRTLGWNAMDAAGLRDERDGCGRQRRVVLIPRCWDQARGLFTGDGD